MRAFRGPLMLLVAVGCTPVLTTPDGASGDQGYGTAADWTAPENSWPTAESLPGDIEAEGWGEGQIPPDFRLTDQFGDEVSLWQFHGKVVALDISTMWCGPCQILAREVDEVQDHYGYEDFIYLTLLPEDVEGDPPDVEDLNVWAERNSVTAPILADYEPDPYAYDIVPDSIWPRVLIIDRNMRVAEDQVQPAADAAIRAAIEAEL